MKNDNQQASKLIHGQVNSVLDLLDKHVTDFSEKHGVDVLPVSLVKSYIAIIKSSHQEAINQTIIENRKIPGPPTMPQKRVIKEGSPPPKPPKKNINHGE